MAIEVPYVIRCAINATYIGRPCVNVIDYFYDNAELSRAEACREGAVRLGVAWNFWVMPNLSNQYVISSLDYIDLTSDVGPSGSLASGGSEPWPAPGGLSGQPYAALASTLVNKSVEATRGTRQGKLYLAPPPEQYVNGNTVESGYLADMNAGLAGFLGQLEVGSVEPEPGVEGYMVVVHASPRLTAPTFSKVTDLSARSQLSRQNRRMRS